MSGSSRIPPSVDGKAAELLERAYSLRTDEDTHALYRDWDVGCGTGLAGVELARHGFTIIDGLDYSADMLSVAGKRGIYRHLIEADLTRPLGLDSASYDAAICTGTFTHGHVGPGCLHELFKLLKPGALFAFSVNAGVWQEMGFEEALDRIEQDGIATRVSRIASVNYRTSGAPDSWLNLYERR